MNQRYAQEDARDRQQASRGGVLLLALLGLPVAAVLAAMCL
jgi:hypothetical protein